MLTLTPPVAIQYIAPVQAQVFSRETELFHVTPAGRVIVDGEDITDDDGKMTDCFVRYMREIFRLTVMRSEVS